MDIIKIRGEIYKTEFGKKTKLVLSNPHFGNLPWQTQKTNTIAVLSFSM